MHDNDRPNTGVPAAELDDVTGELVEVHRLLAWLSGELEGGGIVTARSLKPVIEATVPRLERALDAMNALAAGGHRRLM